jgi:microbial collagenase
LSDTTERLASLIVFAATVLQDGDILVLELQRKIRAVELDLAVFNAVKLVTNAGRIVVQAAGNIGVDLDPEILGDSGAIMVGACDSSVPHNRWVSRDRASNFGERIDCWAWGERVHTTGRVRDPVPPDSYFDFTGTSAATAIIAGCCALIQHAHTLAFGENAARISPPEMREILRAPSNCTPVAGSLRGMPDLKRIVDTMPF